MYHQYCHKFRKRKIFQSGSRPQEKVKSKSGKQIGQFSMYIKGLKYSQNSENAVSEILHSKN